MECSKTRLKLFDGSLMKPLGEVNLQVIHGGQTRVLKFQVVSGTNKPLLSAETCQKLGLLKLGSETEVLTLDVNQAKIIKMSSKDWDTLVPAALWWITQQYQYSTPPDAYLKP